MNERGAGLEGRERIGERLEHLEAPPIPSIADALWLSLYPASYAGLVWHEGVLYVSYYSTHEDKKSCIYLASLDGAEPGQIAAAVDATNATLMYAENAASTAVDPGVAITNFDPEFVQGMRRIVIVACGTSYHAGLVGRYAIEQWARVPVEMDIASYKAMPAPT